MPCRSRKVCRVGDSNIVGDMLATLATKLLDSAGLNSGVKIPALISPIYPESDTKPKIFTPYIRKMVCDGA